MITSPKYSFIQFNQPEGAGCCNGITDISLPVVNATDLYFQVLSDAAPGTLSVVNSVGTVLSTQSGFVEISDGIYGWQSPIDLSVVACDACFQLKIGTALSNVFKKRCDDCFTTLLEYYNDEDYADFIYCNSNFVNRVRLPFYLSKPKMPEDRAVYRKSNGVIKLIKSILTKEYQVLTDFMPGQMHDALAVAMAHDITNVYSDSYTGSISKSSEYNLPWDDDMCVAQADFKVAVSPLAIRNNNCQDCAEVIPPTTCVGVAVPSFTFADAATGTAYNKSVALTGDLPFTLSNIVKPGWMNIAVSGSNIIFSGTPTEADEGSGIAVSFTVANACGSADVSKAINLVQAVECVSVAILGSPALPDGVVGNNYSYTINLSGTVPFTLSNIVKPSWMSIVVSGSNILFSGIPGSGDVGVNITVGLTINNTCGAVDFASTIDVATEAEGGILQIDTSASESGQINSIESSDWYTIPVGGFPVNDSNTPLDTVHSLYSGTLTIDCNVVVDSRVELYINGILNQCTGHVGIGHQVYNFSTVTIEDGDEVRIALVSGDVCA